MRGIRAFNPYNALSASVGAPVRVPFGDSPFTVTHPGILTETGTATIVSATAMAGRPISTGLISPNGVVGFAASEGPDRFRVIAVDEEERELQIDHATFSYTNMSGTAADRLNMEGLFMAMMGHARLFPAYAEGQATTITVSAAGYETTTITLTEDALHDNRIISIPMRRTPISIRVYVRDLPTDTTADTLAALLGTVLPNGIVTHTGHDGTTSNVARFGTGSGTHFILEDVFVQGSLTGTAPQRSVETVVINPTISFRRNADGSFTRDASDRYMIDIFLDDVSFSPVHVQLHELISVDEETGEANFGLAPMSLANFEIQLRNASEATSPVYTRGPGRDASIHEATGLWHTPNETNRGTNNRFEITAGSLLTEFRIVDTRPIPQFLPTEWLLVGDELSGLSVEELQEEGVFGTTAAQTRMAEFTSRLIVVVPTPIVLREVHIVE